MNKASLFLFSNMYTNINILDRKTENNLAQIVYISHLRKWKEA